MTKTRVSAVYALTNKHNGKRYVGSAVDVVKRINQHRDMLKAGKHHCRHLQNSYDKHGRRGFVFSILEYCSEGRLLAVEQKHIDATAPGLLYNTCKVAGSALGIKRRPETRRRLSTALTGRTFSAQHRGALSAALTGRIVQHSPETKRKMSAAAKKVANSTRGRQIRSERAKRMHAEGRITYRERKQSRSAVCKVCGDQFQNYRKPDGNLAQNKLCPVCKSSYVRPRTSFTHTDAARKKISEAARKMWAARRGS